MAEKYEVILSDLARTADDFDRGAARLAAVADLAGTAVDSGDGGCDQAIALALATVDELHAAAVQGLRATADKLTEARSAYATADVTVREWYDTVSTMPLTPNN